MIVFCLHTHFEAFLANFTHHTKLVLALFRKFCNRIPPLSSQTSVGISNTWPLCDSHYCMQAGATAQRPGGEGWVQGKAGPICDTTQFAVTGDITVDKERVTNLKEHREFEKEFGMSH